MYLWAFLKQNSAQYECGALMIMQEFTNTSIVSAESIFCTVNII